MVQMRNVSVRALCVFSVILFHFLWGRAWAGEGITLYVSPSGSDMWSGMQPDPAANGNNGPLATWTAARDRIRQLKKEQSVMGQIEVLIRQGDYQIDEPIVFEPEDSGTADSPVTWRAYPGEQASLSGGRIISGWVQQGPLWVAQLPDVQQGRWWFSLLFVDGKTHHPARSPNEGFYHAIGVPDGDDAGHTSFYFRHGEIQRFENLSDVILMVINSWDTTWLRIADIDEQTGRVRFSEKSPYRFGDIRSPVPYCILHAKEALDAPGEWYLERNTGKLYYYPEPGRRMESTQVVAPVAEGLLTLRGLPDQPIEHLRFEGLGFHHTQCSILPQFVSPHQAASRVGGAIHAEYARHISIRDCEISHISHYAIDLGNGCRRNQIVGNHLFDLGAGGVRVGPDPFPATEITEKESTTLNTVDNNWIHDGGKKFPEGVGVWIGKSSYNTVSHNEIHDLDYTGVSVGWSWGYEPTSAHHNLIEYNHIHHIGKDVLHDMGGVYTLGVSPGTIIRNNLIHDTGDECNGIYTDEGSSDILIENNIVYNTRGWSIYQHYGKENRVINNIFAFSHEGQISRCRELDHLSFFFERNIVYLNNGRLFALRWYDGNFYCNQNCYWDVSGDSLDFPTQAPCVESHATYDDELDICEGEDLSACRARAFDQWRRQGQDVDSLVADPGFADPFHFDFSLRPDSPAVTQLGFRPIDVKSIGLYGSPEWVQQPRTLWGLPRSLPQPCENCSVCYDFESLAVGDVPVSAKLKHGANRQQDGVGIYVSDKNAYNSKHSLRFMDGPDLSQQRYPQAVFESHCRQGILVAEFDLWLEPGFILHHQWRDDLEPYRIGPEIYIHSDGRLWANPGRDFSDQPGGVPQDDPLLSLPHRKWVHLEMRCGLGKESNGTFTLQISQDAGPSQRFEQLPCRHREFYRLDGYAFFCYAQKTTACYLDNLTFRKTDSISKD